MDSDAILLSEIVGPEAISILTFCLGFFQDPGTLFHLAFWSVSGAFQARLHPEGNLKPWINVGN